LKLSVYIAKRYLFAKKSRNAINIISAVSVAGVAVGTMALIIVLSVFNGLETLVTSIFNTFDPDLKVTPVTGKTFAVDSAKLKMLANVNGVACYSLAIEENALLIYGDRKVPGTIKGVDDNYTKVTTIDSSMWEGEFKLKSPNGRVWAVPGAGLAQYLGIRVNFITPLQIWVPRRTAAISSTPDEALRRQFIFPSGIFQVEQTYDSKYIYLPLDFAQGLVENEPGISSRMMPMKRAFRKPFQMFSAPVSLSRTSLSSRSFFTR
jgi:lipoprotein-releasing system permease protein